MLSNLKGKEEGVYTHVGGTITHNEKLYLVALFVRKGNDFIWYVDKGLLFICPMIENHQRHEKLSLIKLCI